MTDKIRTFVNDVLMLASESGNAQERFGRAGFKLDALLRDAIVQTGGHLETLQRVRDELGSALNYQHGAAREFVDKLIDYVDTLRSRAA